MVESPPSRFSQNLRKQQHAWRGSTRRWWTRSPRSSRRRASSKTTSPGRSACEIDETWFEGFDRPAQAKADLESIVHLFLYKEAREFGQRRLERRLKSEAYVYIHFGLDGPLDQQRISYNWKERFSLGDRQTIEAAADRIRAIARDHDLIREGEPRLDPEEVDDAEITDAQIADAIETARERGLDAFDTKRADNKQYDDIVYFERQAYLCGQGRGTTTRSVSDTATRFERLTDRDAVPCPDSHLRTMKKAATPAEVPDADDDAAEAERPEWKRIRDEVLPYFHAGVAVQLDELGDDAIREPVNVAIDTTPWEFFPSPWKDKADIESGDEWVEVEKDDEDGTTERRYPKDDFPEMVHGWKGDHERVYEFATITVVGRDTPIVLGVEPVRKESEWETEEVEDTAKARVVERLLEQAAQHVDINKVFCDRGFDAHEVRDAIDRHGGYYRIMKRKYVDDWRGIEDVEAHPDADAAVNREASLTVDGRTHDVSIIYERSRDEDGKYVVMTVNEDVEPERIRGVVAQYRDRWRIENEYKTIKENFLPRVGTADYRVRFLYFVLAVILYNVWRTTNLLFRDAVGGEVHFGESPPIPAGEMIELIAYVVFDPGD